MQSVGSCFLVWLTCGFLFFGLIDLEMTNNRCAAAGMQKQNKAATFSPHAEHHEGIAFWETLGLPLKPSL